MKKRIKKKIKQIIEQFGYRITKDENFKKKINHERFALNSGERQVSSKIEDIRRDHVARYEVVVNFLKNSELNNRELLGGDIFCGNGYGSHLVSTQTNNFLIGIDASLDAINLARNHYSTEKTFFLSKEYPFKLPKKLFDFIISFETIEHIKDDSKFIDEIYHSLKQNGHLFISAPNQEICAFEKNNYEFHFRHYTFSDILEIITNSSRFELITWYGNGAYDFEKGIFTDHREMHSMEMKENESDSHLTYIFQKK